MLKNILNLKDAQQLNKDEQKNVFGGFGPSEQPICNSISFKPLHGPCPPGKVPHPTKPHCFCCAA